MPAQQQTLRLQAEYQASLRRLRTQVARLVADRFNIAEPSDLAGFFRAFIPAGAGLIAMGQAQAVALADAYVVRHQELERGERPTLEAPTGAGTTVDGRPLEQALVATRAKTFLAIKQGRSVGKALAFGRFSAARLALTETMDAAREEARQQMTTQPSVRGWRWQSSGTTCLACLAADNGQVRSPAISLHGHPGCDCVQEIVYSDVEETVLRPTGKERFESMSAEQQDAMYGQKAELLRSGEVPLDPDHIIERERNNDWRPVITEAPLEALTP